MTLLQCVLMLRESDPSASDAIASTLLLLLEQPILFHLYHRTCSCGSVTFPPMRPGTTLRSSQIVLVSPGGLCRVHRLSDIFMAVQ